MFLLYDLPSHPPIYDYLETQNLFKQILSGSWLFRGLVTTLFALLFWFHHLSKRSHHSHGCLTAWPFASPRESYQHHDTHCWKGGQKITRFWGLRKVHMECMLVGLALSTDIVFSFLLCTERTITRDWLGGQKCVCVCHWHWEWQWRRYYPLCHTFLFPHLST